MKVLICGGGIGGLTAGLCCLHFGHEVRILEQAPALGDVGAGIQVPPNAMKVFEALGCADEIAVNAFRPEAIETRMGQSGLTLFRVPLDTRAEERWGASYLHIHRADYIEALRSVLAVRAPDALELGAALEAYDQDGDVVTAVLQDGRRVEGDVLIGADGVHSPTRACMLGPDKPQFTGHMAWRTVVPIDRLGENVPAPTACAWMGRGRHAVTYRLRGGRLANFVGVVERCDWQEESWSAQGSRAEAMADFAGWHPVIRTLLEKGDVYHRWALLDRAPLARWSDGRAALLGDAAHPMLPFLAQGAAMAVEDAWVLAAELAVEDRPVTASLEAYQAKRLARTSKAQAGSRANGKTFHRTGIAGRLGTYGPMWLAGRFAPGIIRSRLDGLYGYDVTAG